MVFSDPHDQASTVLPISYHTPATGLVFMSPALGVEPMVRDVLVNLGQSAFGSEIISVFDQTRWSVTLHTGEDRQPKINVDSKILSLPNDHMNAAAIIRSPYFRHRLILSFLQGLRLIERAERFSAPLFLSPAAYLLWERVRAADSSAVMMNLAYELSGVFPDIWHHARVMDDGDMVGAKTGAVSDDGLDIARVFHAWFAHPGRLSTTDAQSLSRVDTILRDASDPSKYHRDMTRGLLRSYCQGGSQQSYLPHRISKMTLDGMDPIHAAHLAQIEQEQQGVQFGAVCVRDRDLAERLFGQ